MLIHRPAPPLAEFIDLIWLSEDNQRPQPKDRMLPSGAVSLVINLHENRFRLYDSKAVATRTEDLPGALVVGAYSQFFVTDAAAQVSTVGVTFNPGGAFTFTRIPANEFANRHLPLREFLGRSADSFHEKLIAAPRSEMISRLEQALLRRLPGAKPLHPAVSFGAQLLRRNPSIRIQALSDRVGLSRRRFAELFQEQVGLAPKAFSRVQRFQQALAGIRQSLEPIDWADFALSSGYYDQAHLIHEFGACSGLTPNALVAALDPADFNHVPLSN